MTEFEAIEKLCDIAKLQAEIIKKQAAALAQADIFVQDEELQKMRDTAANELELINKEYN